MPDVEKVIKGLEEISDYFFNVYHRSKDREEINKAKDRCDAVEDALALLKEQEPAKVRHLHGTKVTVHEEIVFTDECENCSGYLLKHWKACPICGKPVIWE